MAQVFISILLSRDLFPPKCVGSLKRKIHLLTQSWNSLKELEKWDRDSTEKGLDVIFMLASIITV